MSLELINRSADLKRLRDEGYGIEVSNGYLLIDKVPYVDGKKQVSYGTLISRLELAGNSTVKPNDHVALWAGDYPCDSKGIQLTSLVNNSGMQEKIREGLIATCSFSHKPEGGYADYYQKMTRYVQVLENEARALDPMVTAKTFSPVGLTEEESVFCYLDTASSRAGITSINEKLKNGRLAIVGLGGTGSYILDLVAKTHVGEIHLFDGDDFLQHNAFRSPGAPSFDDLMQKTTKVEWFTKNYSKMRRKIIPHPKRIDESNMEELCSMDFVFLCVDKNEQIRTIVNYLIEKKIPFIDVGLDLYVENEMLGGSVRVTTCTPSFHDHISSRITFGSGEDGEYSSNIQIADMNALNAALAVIKWKKLCGFYHDFGHEYHTIYGIVTNTITNDEVVNETQDN